MEIIGKFKEALQNYENTEERMGNKLKFIYNVDKCEVTVYSEEWDCYDGYNNLGTPYYWSISNTWEDLTILEFAKLMEYYLEYKQFIDDTGIFCLFTVI